MTMGREAIWNTEPRMLEVMNMTAEVSQTTASGGAQRRTESKQPKPRPGRARSALILRVTERYSRATVLYTLEVVWKGLVEDMALTLDGET